MPSGTIAGGTTSFEASTAGSDLLAARDNLYNGNISHMVTSITKPSTGEVLPNCFVYTYDQLDRLKQAKAFTNLDLQNNQWQSGSTYSGRYYNSFTYGLNGNILAQQRGSQGEMLFDNLASKYHTDAFSRRQKTASTM